MEADLQRREESREKGRVAREKKRRREWGKKL